MTGPSTEALLARRLLVVVMVCLPLGPAALEIATGLGALAVLPLLRRAKTRAALADLLAPLAAITALALLVGWSRDPGWPRDALGVLWSLALVVVVPLLPASAGAVVWGLRAAAAVGAGAVLWAASQGARAGPAMGPFSHHLTLGFALLPPLGVALARRRWPEALGLTAGVLATLSLGPLLGLGIVAAGALSRRPLAALLAGVAGALGVLPLLVGQTSLHERAVLWASGAEVTLAAPLGSGTAPGAFRGALSIAQDLLQPGFHFPLHPPPPAPHRPVAAGLPGWVAWGALLVALWQRAGVGGRAGLAAVLVGGLTQDTLGDLEVLRAVVAWALLREPDPEADVQIQKTASTDTLTT